ncbi:SCO1 protein [Tepidimonas alkaliphilus]|uniref:SCO1 protein n=1 Tax=Tepidimonas alkaliphilus TaxID=2588942 RepID=A0A554WCT7_9BURK|nr:SCO family protein [Tepidimonas alkaliphilus]TSE21387.1 SCO1 protein [Tepidimonas alkaliphilus]
MNGVSLSNGARRGWLRGVSVALMMAIAPWLAGCERGGPKDALRGIDVTGAPYGKTLELTDQHGQRRTLQDFRGKVVMLYFGFVQCPDVCPTALARTVEVMQRLGPDAQRVQLLFVTVDPERDTPELLREYLAAFHPSFLGLTGTPQEIAAAAREFKVYYAKVPTGSGYTMDHSAQTYLIDPQGRLRIVLKHEQTADDYAHDIAWLLRESAG